MATGPWNSIVQQLRTAVLPVHDEITDADLLESFVLHRNPDALAVLVHRHGPLVWNVCRRLLRKPQDAEDAFQATFLVLVRKAATIRHKERCAHWLYRVAYQTALKARAVAARRSVREQQVPDMPEPAVPPPDLGNDLQPLLDRELNRLPEKYGAVLVLCDLEGKTRPEAARQLGWPEGTVAGRLARARAMLAKRLSRRGLVLSATSLAAALPGATASATVPPSVISSTIDAVAAGQVARGVLSPTVAALTEGVLKTMLMTKVKAVVFVLVLVALVGGCLTAVAQTLSKEGTALAEEASAKASVGDENKADEPKVRSDQGQGLPSVHRSMVDKAVRLADGDWLVYRYQPTSDSGVQVYRMDSTMSKRRWHARCNGLGQAHEQFGQSVDANVVADQVIITCETRGGWGGDGSHFEERLDLATGKQIERKVTRK
jgi:RNA polymerase sigma factor (sigma-70 family)